MLDLTILESAKNVAVGCPRWMLMGEAGRRDWVNKESAWFECLLSVDGREEKRK
jgi:hypothetical protein